jgi:uncharacterized spore protein YtfJ
MDSPFDDLWIRTVRSRYSNRFEGANRYVEDAPETTMDLSAEFQSLSETIESSATANTVYGPPVERRRRTVVPLARIEYGLGGGGGGGGGGADDVGGGGGTSGDDDDTEGGGLGGGFSARPVGALEVTDDGTRFVATTDRWRSIALVLGGFVSGLLISSLASAFGIGR